MEGLLLAGAKINQRDGVGCTPIHHAIREGHLSILSLLRKCNADIEQLDGFRRTSLQLSTSLGDHPVVGIVLSEDIAVNIADKWGRTALHQAAQFGDVSMIRTLLRRGADVEKADVRGFTPLQFAVAAGKLSAVVVLLDEASANPSWKDNSGCTSLDWAVVLNHSEIISELKNHGATHTSDFRRALRLYSRIPSSTNHVWHHWPLSMRDMYNRHNSHDFKGEAQGGAQTIYQSFPNLEWFLAAVPNERHEGRVNLDARDVHGWTALHLFAINGLSREGLNLMNAGCDVTVQNEAGGWTALHICAQKNHCTFAQELVKKGACVDAEDHSGLTPLTVAVLYGNIEVSETLRELGADLERRDPAQRSLLHLAAKQRNVDIIQWLLRSGVNPNLQDKHGYTALHLGINTSVLSIVKCLLEKGADPNLRDNKGDTALHLCLKGIVREEIADLLFQWNADPTLLNHLGETPYTHAVSREDDSRYRGVALKILKERPDVLKYGKDKLLEVAVSGRQKSTMHYLLTGGVNYQGSTDLLSLAPDLSTLQLLLEHGFQPQNSKALHKAVDRRDVRFAKCLIEYGANFDDRDENGRTLLMLAISTGSKDMVSLLLDANADLHARNTSSWFGSYTALDLAYRENRSDLVDLLKAAESRIANR